MAAEIWKAEEKVYEMMRRLIANYHPDLALVDEDIAIIFKEKASKSGGIPVTGTVSKATPLFKVLGDKEWKFVITLAAEAWRPLNDRYRMAQLDHLLCACSAEEQDDGTVKCSIRKPDVVAFRDEIERWGVWKVSGELADPSEVREMLDLGEEDDGLAAA